MQVAELPDLLTVQDVAGYLRVPVSWVYERTRTGAIPVRKIGRHCRVPRNEFLAWIERQEVGPPETRRQRPSSNWGQGHSE